MLHLCISNGAVTLAFKGVDFGLHVRLEGRQLLLHAGLFCHGGLPRCRLGFEFLGEHLPAVGGQLGL